MTLSCRLHVLFEHSGSGILCVFVHVRTIVYFVDMFY